MNIETTINTNSYVSLMILKASRLTGQPKKQVVSSLMRRLADDHEEMAVTWSRVRYQKRDIKSNWRHMHLTLRPDEYEFFLDLRKVYKFSVSYLIAYAVEKYLEEIIKKLSKGSDNYRYKNYMFQSLIVDGVICWILSWGIPRSMLTSYY
jgi:hypothetical protein